MAFGKHPKDECGLDGQYVHKLWLELGTLNRVGLRLYNEGYRSPRSGKQYSSPALVMSAWRWCIKHPEESYEITKQYREAHGETLTMSDWYNELIAHARSALSPAGYRSFLKGNNLEDRARSRK